MNQDNPQDLLTFLKGSHLTRFPNIRPPQEIGDRITECALPIQVGRVIPSTVGTVQASEEYTGGSVSYYSVDINNPTSGGDGYTAECNDIIEALKMSYAEGNAFKAIWRSCAARHLGLAKKGYKDGLYDAEKVVFFGQRMVEQAKNV